MQQNVGGLDRTARLMVGPALLVAALAAFTGYVHAVFIPELSGFFEDVGLDVLLDP